MREAVRDIGLLDSAAARPVSSAFGMDACPTLAEQDAALLHSIARNRALVDGNKRDVAQGNLDVPQIAVRLEARRN